MNRSKTQQLESRWPHRWAVLLCCATFPLIWVGGLVTTYDAGMAVPDWPSTFGYNLFLYPWTTWIFGPWDLFIEHGHRLLGALVGLLTIGLMVSVWLSDNRRWVRRLAAFALLLVIAQGILGGARVLFDARTLAMVHGCTGPLFLSVCVALAVVTSRLWKNAEATAPHGQAGRLHRLAAITALLTYMQLVLGATLRHVPVTASPGMFRASVVFHIVIAVVLLLHVVLLAANILRHHRDQRLVRPVIGLIALLVLQMTLGPATWVVKYGWPHFLTDFQFAADYTVQANSMPQALVVTSHVATGSLILAMTVLLAVRSGRLVRGKVAAVGSTAILMEFAR